MKCRPYSFTPGIPWPIPGTNSTLEAFPDFYRIDGEEFPHQAKKFKVTLDLERDAVFIGKKRINGLKTGPVERLFLGSFKAQEWDKLLSRNDRKTLLPIYFLLSQKIPEGSSFSHLRGSYATIRELFFKEEGENFHFLPNLPEEFDTGKMFGIKTSLCTLDFSWSKNALQIVTLYDASDDVAIKIKNQYSSVHVRRSRSVPIQQGLPLRAL